jgi:hypothetical protein
MIACDEPAAEPSPPAPREPREQRFGRGYDAGQLETVAACVEAYDALLLEIAVIENQLTTFYGMPADTLSAARRAWLKRAKSALALKHRIRHAIAYRKGMLLIEERRAVGEEQILREHQLRRERLQKQLDHEAQVRARREREHEKKMQRIAASNAQTDADHRLFVRLVRERLGDAVAEDIWAEVHRRATQGTATLAAAAP